MARTSIPKEVQEQVLVVSRRRCSVCYGLNRDAEIKQGQIAHIDGDATNNDLDNLVFLCLVHHDEYDSRRSQSKGITSDEIRRFRNELHEAIEGTWKQSVAPGKAPASGETKRTYGSDPLAGLLSLSEIEAGLERESNPRFGFSFLHPRYWDRRDPDNGDGNAYCDPKDPRIEMLAWGGYAVVTHDLDAWVSQSLDWLKREEGFALLSNVPSGRHLVDFIESSGAVTECREQIEGYRLVYSVGFDTTQVTSMQTFLQYQDTQIGLLCRAPTSRYQEYENLFLVLSHGIRVLGPHSAPFARGEVKDI